MSLNWSRQLTYGMACLLTVSMLLGCNIPRNPDRAITLAVAQTDRGVMIWLPESVLFEFGKDTLDDAEATPYLERVANLILEKSRGQVELEGHTDNVGSDDFNLALSERRAITVRQKLQSLGVPAERMSIKGFGMTRPIAPNDSETGRKLNRRVEIVLLGQQLDEITAGAPEGAFEEAFARLKRLIEAQQ